MHFVQFTTGARIRGAAVVAESVTRATGALLVGLVALAAALGGAGVVHRSGLALHDVVGHPVGVIAVVLLGAALLGASFRRFVRAAREDGDDTARRLATVGAAAVHGAIGIAALEVALGGGPRGAPRTYLPAMLSEPCGRAVVGIAGACVVAAGLRGLKRAWMRGRIRHIR